MKQLVEPESIRVRMFLIFLICELMNRAEGEWKEAALRFTQSSRAESLNEDVLGRAGTSADEAPSLGFPKTQLRKWSLHSAPPHLQW